MNLYMYFITYTLITFITICFFICKKLIILMNIDMIIDYVSELIFNI